MFSSASAISNSASPDEASDAFEKAASSAPEPFIALRAVGIYFYNKKEMGQARLYLERAQLPESRR